MKMKIMITWCIVLSVIILNITGCKENQYEMDYDISGSMKDEIFDLRLYLDRDTYSTKESIHCYATLEYIGEEENITIYSSDPLVGFGLKDDQYLMILTQNFIRDIFLIQI